eukprot:scaffold239686_cov18-Prasinocladus_malaysianus.AAC.1
MAYQKDPMILIRLLTGDFQVYLNWHPADNIALPDLSLAFDPSTFPGPYRPETLAQTPGVGVYASCLPATHCKDKIRALFPGQASRNLINDCELSKPYI